MFPSFTGNARQKRQVNLSGRNANPFAASSSSKALSASSNTQTALAQAQQERLHRKHERERPPAAVRIQRSWRGYHDRLISRAGWRRQWDVAEGWPDHSQEGTYESEAGCLNQLRLLVHFFDLNSEDLARLQQFAQRYLHSLLAGSFREDDKRWTYLLFRLATITMLVLETHSREELGKQRQPRFLLDVTSNLLKLLQSLAHTIPEMLAKHSHRYYRTVASLCSEVCPDRPEQIGPPMFELLNSNSRLAALAYDGFCAELLTVPNLSGIFHGLQAFDAIVKYRDVAEALSGKLSSTSSVGFLQSKSHEQLLWLLAYFIHFHRIARADQDLARNIPDANFIRVVSVLVSYLSGDIASRIDMAHNSATAMIDGDQYKIQNPLPEFVLSEISNLISEENVSGLLTSFDVDHQERGSSVSSTEEASILASYALMLLRVFPRRSDEIRMWLYRGSTSSQSAVNGERIPAVKYFFWAARSTSIFQDIKGNPEATVRLLKSGSRGATGHKNQEWRLILLFMELYIFPLKIMDDEEFLSGSSSSTDSPIWTRQSALPIAQIEEFTTFLKNLAFSLYWHSSELNASAQTESSVSLADYFGRVDPSHASIDQKFQRSELAVAGISGLSLGYLKGLATSVLRMIYERE